MHAIAGSQSVNSSRKTNQFSSVGGLVWIAFVISVSHMMAAGASLWAQQSGSRYNSGDDLWIQNQLPKGAYARYGAMGRNPNAIGIELLRFSNNGKFLAAKDQRDSIRILDLENKTLAAVLRTESHRDFVFTPDDKFIAVGNRKEVQIWDIEKQKDVRTIAQPGYLLAASSSTSELLIANRGKLFRYRWPLPSEPATLQTTLNGIIQPAGLSSDGSLVLFHNGSQSELFKTDSGIPVDNADGIIVRQSTFSKDSTRLAVFAIGNQQLDYLDLRNAKKYRYDLREGKRFYAAAFSIDNRFLFTSNLDNQIVVWDLVTKSVVARVTGHDSKIAALAVPNTGLLRLASGASGVHDRSVIFWDLRDRIFPPIEVLGEFDLDAIWKDLGSRDAKKSLTATNLLFRSLREEPSRNAMLVAKLPLSKVDDAVPRLIAELDSPKFRVRENAMESLLEMVELIRPQLERRLEDSSQEAKWRIQNVLKSREEKPLDLNENDRRLNRTILALELCADEESKKTLRLLAEFCQAKNVVDEARSALRRLEEYTQ